MCGSMASGRSTEKNNEVKERTITVSGIPDGILPNEVMVDKLIIHFQKSENGGGDVETIDYPTKIPGVAHIYFEDIKVAERVLEKEQILEDQEMPGRYPLKTAHYTADVFVCVSVNLDLDIFRGKYNLQDFVQNLKDSFSSLRFTELQPSGKINVMGAFSAIRGLREDLLAKAEFLTYSVDILRDRKREEQSFGTQSKNAASFRADPSTALIQATDTNKEMLFVDTDIYKYMIQVCSDQYEKEVKKYSIKSSACEIGANTVIYLENESNSPHKLKMAIVAIQGLIASLQTDLRKEQIALDGCSVDEKKEREKRCKDLEAVYPRVLVLPFGSYIEIIGSSSDCYQFIQNFEKTRKVQMKIRNMVRDGRYAATGDIGSPFGGSYHISSTCGPAALPPVVNDGRLASLSDEDSTFDGLYNIRDRCGPQSLYSTFLNTQKQFGRECSIFSSPGQSRSSFESKYTKSIPDEPSFQSLPITFSSDLSNISYPKYDSNTRINNTDFSNKRIESGFSRFELVSGHVSKTGPQSKTAADLSSSIRRHSVAPHASRNFKK